MTTTGILNPDPDDYPPVTDLDTERARRALANEPAPPDQMVDEGDGNTYTMVAGQVVDPSALTETGDDRAVIPGWLRDRSMFVQVAGEAVVRFFRAVAFHVLRLPLYWFRLTVPNGWAGARRATRQLAGWVGDPGFEDDRATMREVGRGDINELRADHTAKVRRRTKTVAFWSLLALGAAVYAWFVLSPLVLALVFVVIADAFGIYGRPETDGQIIERNTYAKAVAPPFTEGLMLEALRQAGAEPKNGRKVHVLQPPAKIRTGWEAIVSMGVPATDIIKNLKTFATAVDRPENCVWLNGDPEQAAGWLRIVITRKSLRHSRMPDWPYRHGGTFNYFTDAVPVGVDETGEPVAASKAYKSTVYGGIMGAGKTVSMINAVLGQAVDPRVELHINDLKGGTDWLDFSPIAHFLRAGTDPEDAAAVMADLEDLNKRMDRRFQTLRDLPDDLRSPKTTDTLASRKDLDLHPIVIVIDETQEMFEFADDAAKYEALVSRLIKKGRGVAITVEAGTQEVKKATLPIAGLCHWRHCMSVQGHTAVDLVLGTGAYQAGFNADNLTADDVGIGFFGSGKEISLCRSYYIDPDEGEVLEVTERLRAERIAVDRLSGMAAGEIEPDTDPTTFVHHLARYWPTNATKVSHEVMAGHLATVAPDRFADITPDMISTRGRSHGLSSVDNCKGLDGKYTLKGFALSDVVHFVDEAGK